MKQFITKYLQKIGLGKNRYLYNCFKRDCKIFEKYSAIEANNNDVIASKIRIVSHTIEKGFSLSDCRVDFGKQKIQNLIQLLRDYEKFATNDKDAVSIARSIIYEYYMHRKRHSLDVSFIPEDLQKKSELDIVRTGAMPFVKNIETESFFIIAKSRHSIRNYANCPVLDDDIKKAVALAQTAPSACNRQATRVYACTNPEIISAIQKAHGGMRSFGSPGVIFAITQDIGMYINEYERNTWLVDAGIFCMNLLYALLSIGIGSCPVIWGGMEDEDQRMASLLNISERCRIAILVVAGYIPEDGCKTPCSSKRPVESILKIIH